MSQCDAVLQNVYLKNAPKLGYHSVRCELEADHVGVHKANTVGGALEWDPWDKRNAVGISPGDVVQITPKHRSLAGCFAEVLEVHPWGLKATVPTGSSQEAPVRLASADFVFVGRAPWRRTG